MAILAVTSALADEQTDITIEASANGVSDGELMRLQASLASDAVISMGETGWTQVEQVRSSTGLDRTLAVFIKFASAESGTYTVNQDGVSASFVTQISSYSGVDTTTPQDNTAQTSAVESESTPNQPNFTTQTDRAFVECVIYARGASLGVPANAPTGYTKFGSNLQTNAYTGAAYRDIIGVGLEQPGTWNSFSASSDIVMITWGMRPAAAGGGTVSNQLQGSNLGADLYNGTIL